MDELGKRFEDVVKRSLQRLPDSSVDRFYDQMTGYKMVSRNPSDFVFYHYPNEFYIECKTTKGSSFAFSRLTQYDLLIQKSGIKGVRAGVLIFFYEHMRVLYVPVSSIKSLQDSGHKSFNITKLDGSFNYKEVPGEVKRVFLDPDLSCLLTLEEGW